jgi:5'-3' exonuclease
MDRKDLLKLLDNVQEDGNQTPEKNENRVLIIDGLNLFLRNFAVLNYINPQGTHVGGLGGFLRSLGSLVKQIQPTSIYIIFDGVGSSLNRKNLLPEYKSNRNINRVNANIFDNLDDENESKVNKEIRTLDDDQPEDDNEYKLEEEDNDDDTLDTQEFGFIYSS